MFLFFRLGVLRKLESQCGGQALSMWHVRECLEEFKIWRLTCLKSKASGSELRVLGLCVSSF